jgi:glycolate oxidase subunit GlcD
MENNLISAALLEKIAAIVGDKRVSTRKSEMLPLSADGLPNYRHLPGVAIFPGTRDEVVAVVRELYAAGVPFVARGAGTGLSGGALADGTALICLNRLTRILEVNETDMYARVEPGVVNARLTREASKFGLHYAPDPSSQAACTIGGNVAENSGGPHCLKYGVTLNHVLALDVVLPDGRLVTLGGIDGERAGYDLLGAFIGSEGCFGIALEVTVRLTRNPEAIRTMLADFSSIREAAQAVSAIIAAGIVPAALEMMDAPTIRAVESSIYAAGYPSDAAAVLLVELDGEESATAYDVKLVDRLCREAGARSIRAASSDVERARLWQGRKKAFGAMGRVAPNLVVQDAVVPRTRLAHVLEQIHAIGDACGIEVCNVFHAGDGNLHPNIPYDASDDEAVRRVERATRLIMELCIAEGGSVTGEHGIGIDKLNYMEKVFSDSSLSAMCTLRQVFDPQQRANPGKVVPLHSCREWIGSPAFLRNRKTGPAA